MTDAKEPIYDLVIRGGKIVDGMRTPAYIGDLAVKDGKVAEIGAIRGAGRQEIDAKGLIVAPGVIDVHTHYDAQLGWDPYATASGWHGVTSIVIGNCGFGFAPCRPEDKDRYMRRMVRVEAIPYEAMKEGMRFDWSSQAEYFDSLERSGLGLNVASYIPQTPIRAYVMGEDDNQRKQATPEEIEQMKELVRDGYRAGALGLSTDFYLIDRDMDGKELPSQLATMEETEALVAVAREFNVGSIEMTPQTLDIEEEHIALLERFAELSGRPVYYNALTPVNHKPEAWQKALKLLEEANKKYRIFGLASTHRVEHVYNLIEYNLFDDMPEWNKALACSIEERLANLADPAVRAKLQDNLDNYPYRLFSGKWDRTRILVARNKDYVGRTVAKIAEERGTTPLDVFCDINIEEEMTTMFMQEDIAGDDQRAVEEIVKSPYSLVGLSDGGAHTRFCSLGKYPTLYLMNWVRDTGVVSLEEAHWRMSYMCASALGLEGVGTLQPGMRADIIVYDIDKLAVTPEIPVYEPVLGGGERLVQKAKGYRAIIVNGVPTFEDGECTGALPGKVLRTSAYDPNWRSVAMAAE
jgi:N-acyl-D-aspartate/D-glutamate deacylase